MRKVLISLLLASAAASPAFAGPNDDNDRQAAREARQQAREERQAAHENRSSNQSSNQSQSSNNSRPERPDRPDRNFVPPQQQQSFQPQQSFERPAHQNFNNGANQRNVEAYRARQQAVQNGRQDRVEQRAVERADRQQQIRDNREARQANRFHPPVSDVPRPGTQPPLRVEQNRAPIQWSSNWRNNSKYDWQNWRRHHRSFFHLGFYYDPFGWSYNPFEIGWRMWPSYYSSRFWINDPWYYRLPYAPPGTRWIRYYDDAILVDMWSGQVVDVIYDFFW